MSTKKIPIEQKGGALTAFFILAAISLSIGFAGLVLGTEPRLVLERSADREFRVSASNHFAGLQYYSKTIDGVSEVVQDDAMRDRSDSSKENRKRRKQKHLDFFGVGGARVGWDRESDQSMIEEYMRSEEKTLSLAEPPPTWRMIAAWFCVVLGALSFIGAIKNSIFPPKKSV